MEKSDFRSLIEAAQAWHRIALQLQESREKGEWDDLGSLQHEREKSVSLYQRMAESFDFKLCSSPDLEQLETVLKEIQYLENELIIRFEDYQHQILDSLKSIRMESSLLKRYGSDGE